MAPAPSRAMQSIAQETLPSQKTGHTNNGRPTRTTAATATSKAEITATAISVETAAATTKATAARNGRTIAPQNPATPQKSTTHSLS